jgi:tetratricopeptide (TPR) repeat protein
VRTAANEALAEVNEAVRRAENWQTLRAKALVHWGRPNESVQALALLDRIITDEPKRLELRVLRARFLAESGQEYRAAGDDSYVLKHGGPLSYVLQHRAATWLVANEWQKARADYAATLALDPDNDDWTVMLIGLDSWDEPETALAKIQEFLDRKPKTFSAWYLKGQIELKQQRRAKRPMTSQGRSKSRPTMRRHWPAAPGAKRRRRLI